MIKKTNLILTVLMAALIGVMLSGCQNQSQFSTVVPESVEETETTAIEEEKLQSIWVQIAGAVVNPGVYELQAGNRIKDAVWAAGGLTEDAAFESINQAEFLTDSQSIYVSRKEEWTQIQSSSGNNLDDTDGRINLNTATKEQLMTLPGIGEAKASGIIQYREEHGSFQKIEELMNVPGIKEGVYTKILDLIQAP